MAAYPECLELLIQEFSRLPGIGKKSAERLAFHILRRTPDEVRLFSEALMAARERIRDCETCHGISETEECAICADTNRDDATLCVVEHARDIFALERGSMFRGRYHVLGGVISPMNGVGPEQLTISSLMDRLDPDVTKEVILALNPSTEGETTSLYLADMIKPMGLTITRIAYGLPVGGELEYSDPVTLARALEGRRSL